MYTYLSLILLVALAGVNGARSLEKRTFQMDRNSLISETSPLGLDVCQDCIKEAVQEINVLLNLILDEGIIHSCSDLCGALANKTNSSAAGDACLVVCNTLGIGQFIKLLEHSDLDPIWYCQIVKLCPVNDHGDGKFVDFHMIPSSGRIGTEFFIACSFQTKNGTGPGMITIIIVTPQNQSVGNSFLLDAKPPGVYEQSIIVPTVTNVPISNDDTDVNGFPTGRYNVTGYLCNGECGSQHPHSVIYDVGQSFFVVTP